MKKSVLAIFIFVFSICSTQAQWWSGNKEIKGNGNMVTKHRKVSPYDQVNLVGFMDVALVKGREGDLIIEAESNLQQHITTEVSGGRLKIAVEKGVSIQPSRNKTVKVTVPYYELTGVQLTGSGDIVSQDPIQAEEFSLSVTGSGDVSLSLEAESVQGKITGSGDIELRGSTKKLQCQVTGSGDFEAFALKAQLVDAQISGSGDIYVHVEKELQARVSGSGDIEYQGNPEREDFKTFGSGDISKK